MLPSESHTHRRATEGVWTLFSGLAVSRALRWDCERGAAPRTALTRPLLRPGCRCQGHPPPELRTACAHTGSAKPPGSLPGGKARLPAGTPSASGQEPRGCSAVGGSSSLVGTLSATGPQAARRCGGQGGASALCMKPLGGVGVCWAGCSPDPSAPCLTSGPRRAGPWRTHRSAPRTPKTSWWWTSARTHRLLMASPMFSGPAQHPRLPSSFRWFPAYETTLYDFIWGKRHLSC